MPSAQLAAPRETSGEPDELDRVLDSDNAVADFLKDIPTNDAQPAAPARRVAEADKHDEDQEIQIKKQRKPVAKLDEDRLLSNAGITKLRKVAKTRLKFHGKGHEMKDISNLLNMYQLWLDDLYPRAKFRDALSMVEKVGHRKRMQVMRKAWLDETKLGRSDLSPGRELHDAEDIQERADDAQVGEDANNAPIFSTIERTSIENNEDIPQDDELDALLAEESVSNEKSRLVAPATRRPGPFEDDMSDDDDAMDAMLAETETSAFKAPTSALSTEASGPFLEDMPDEDELDALLAEHE